MRENLGYKIIFTLIPIGKEVDKKKNLRFFAYGRVA